MKKIIYFFPLLLCLACGEKQTTETATTAQTPAKSAGALSIAVINTDSILVNFNMYIDKQDEIEKARIKLNADFERQAKNWQADYDNYLKVGSTMTLSEQQNKEAQLQRRQQEIAALQQKYSDQIVTLSTQAQMDLTNTIYDFIEQYNKEHDNYDLILSKGRAGGSAALYSTPEMDITAEVMKALNEHYANRKK